MSSASASSSGNRRSARGQITRTTAYPANPARGPTSAVSAQAPCWNCINAIHVIATTDLPRRTVGIDCFRETSSLVSCWFCRSRNQSCEFVPLGCRAHLTRFVAAADAVFQHRLNSVGENDAAMVAAKQVVATEHGNLSVCRRTHGGGGTPKSNKKRRRDDDDDDASSGRQLLELMTAVSDKLDALDAKIDAVVASMVPRRSGRT